MGLSCQLRRVVWVLVVIVAVLALPATAAAHGPINPAASSFLARIGHVPAGAEAKVVDGDQRMWLKVAPGETLVVLDYSQAPYLRFDSAGVQVNENSQMYYLNQVPVEVPPAGLGPRTRPHWLPASSGHSYEWHDGRLSDLSTTTLTPGASNLGQWRIALTVNGAPSALSGGLFYRPSPSIVWFWPIIVCLLCVLAALRLRRPELDTRVARWLAVGSLAGFAVAITGQQLHGRPTVTVGQAITLAVAAAFVVWAARRLILRRHGWFTFFLIAAVAIWEGGSLTAVLVDGYVLLALPPLVARIAVVTCQACGAAMLPVVFALAERPAAGRAKRRRGGPPGVNGHRPEDVTEDLEAWQPSA